MKYVYDGAITKTKNAYEKVKDPEYRQNVRENVSEFVSNGYNSSARLINSFIGDDENPLAPDQPNTEDIIIENKLNEPELVKSNPPSLKMEPNDLFEEDDEDESFIKADDQVVEIKRG